MIIRLPKDIFQFSLSFSPVKRALIRIKGVDATKFLHGLCTNNIQKLADDPKANGIPALFLNSIGRILYDTFIFKRTNEDYFIDCDPRIDKDLISHLLMYRLRNRIEIDSAPDWRLLLSWKLDWCQTVNDAISIDDTRCSWPLKRTLLPINEPLINEEDCQGQDWYDALRMYYGIPEGPIEITRNKAVAHEYNFDIMNAIDFQKGCYVGQEFITRTEKSGIIRKRILPFIAIDESGKGQEIKNERELKRDNKEKDECENEEKEAYLTNKRDDYNGISFGTEIMNFHNLHQEHENGIVNLKSENIIGKFICINGNMGLSMLRLDKWNKRTVPYHVHRPDPSSINSYIAIHPFIPEWWPPKTNTFPSS